MTTTYVLPDTTTTAALDVAPAPATASVRRLEPPDGTIGVVGAALTIAVRTLRQFVRTPQLIVVGAMTSAMFVLIFRYVFGGAIGTGRIAYVDWLIPAMVTGTALFASAAVGVADDVESGLFDRLRSLPIPRSATLLGRALADTALVLWGAAITLLLGVAIGFRFHGGVLDAAAAIGLVVVCGFALTWVMIAIGLAAGSNQAAQGMSFMVFPFIFVSSAYVPVESMPGWMQAFARNQPVTHMIGAIRSLAIGEEADVVLGHSTGYFVVRSVLWAVAIAVVFGFLAARLFARR